MEQIKVGIKIHNGKAVLYRSIDNKVMPVLESLEKVKGYYVYSTRESMEDYWHDLYLLKDGENPKDYYRKGIHLYEDAQEDSEPFTGDLSHIIPEDSPIWEDNLPEYFIKYYL